MGKKVSQKALKIKNSTEKINVELKEIDYNLRKGKVAFEFVCNNRCRLSEWQGQELKLLIDCFKKIETLTWEQIFLDSGLNWERNKNIAIEPPINYPADAKLYSFRVNGKMRIYGYRAQEFFI